MVYICESFTKGLSRRFRAEFVHFEVMHGVRLVDLSINVGAVRTQSCEQN